MYAEFVGFTPEALTLVERFRLSPSESRSDIIVRVFSPLLKGEAGVEGMDFGQGVWLPVGERPRLFLSRSAKKANKPDAIAEIRADGFYLDGQKVEPSRGSVLQPAMERIQERTSHRNAKGKIVSLSAWAKWHVVRGGNLVSLFELKDPKLAHRRGRATLTLEDLDLYECA